MFLFGGNCRIKLMCNENNVHKAFCSTISPIHNVGKINVTGIMKVKPKESKVSGDIMLWHGTKLENVDNILNNGLQLSDKISDELMFGSGIYLTDIASKAVQFSDRPKGCVFLCEVWLGNVIDQKGKYQNKPPPEVNNTNINTIKGCGNRIPSENTTVLGIATPLGPILTNDIGSHLKFNEYVVKEPWQVIPRYIVFYDMDTLLQK